MFQVLILICSLNMAPAQCQTYNAVDVIPGPDAANVELCGLQGQAYIAQIAYGTPHKDDEYVKIKCTRTSIGKDNVG
ncbi:MAG: hypothetical protein ACOY3L_06645 [Pseudomonadota bacterium]